MAEEAPKFPHGYLGAQAKFYEWGMRTVSHTEPTIKLQGNEVEVKFGAERKVRATATLINVEDGLEYNQYVFTHNHTQTLTFLIVLPKTGWWKLQVFAIPADSPETMLLGVYNYAIFAPKLVKFAYPFPKQYTAWDERCKLYEPHHLHKDIKTENIHFKVQIAGQPYKVAVVAGNDWHQLVPGNGDIWEQDIPIKRYVGKNEKVTLNVNRGENKTNYDTMLEWVV